MCTSDVHKYMHMMIANGTFEISDLKKKKKKTNQQIVSRASFHFSIHIHIHTRAQSNAYGVMSFAWIQGNSCDGDAYYCGIIGTLMIHNRR